MCATPTERLQQLAEQLEAGDVPPTGELVAELRNIARQMGFLEGCLKRHVQDDLLPLTEPKPG